MKWEYKVIKLRLIGLSIDKTFGWNEQKDEALLKKWEEQLNNLGKEDWELVTVSHVMKGVDQIECFFKRVKK